MIQITITITIKTIYQGDMSAKFANKQTNAGDIQTLEANKHSENWLWKNKPARQSKQANYVGNVD